jgi:hypothetical protein
MYACNHTLMITQRASRGLHWQHYLAITTSILILVLMLAARAAPDHAVGVLLPHEIPGGAPTGIGMGAGPWAVQWDRTQGQWR